MNLADILSKAGLDSDDLRPGESFVRAFPAEAESHDGHCMVIDWTNPLRLVIRIKPGLTGEDLPPEELDNYPIWLQKDTFFSFPLEDQKGVLARLARLQGAQDEPES